MSSKRLSREEKAQILEQADDYLVNCCDHVVSSEDSSDFQEGVAKGALLAFEIFQQQSEVSSVVAHSIVALIARNLREASKNRH
jgi:hypothetical protein